MKKVKIITISILAIILLAILLTDVWAKSFDIYTEPKDENGNMILNYYDMQGNNNIYCIEHNQSFNTDKSYKATTKVVINGDNAKFYRSTDGINFSSKAEMDINHSSNNILACILTGGTIDGKSNYRLGYGAYHNYNEAQYTVWQYIETWVKNLGINGKMGFGNIGGYYTTTGSNWVAKAKVLAEQWKYKVTFYLVMPVSNGASWQSIIITYPDTPEPKKINIPVTKNWIDGDNKFGSRPTEIKVKLLANGVDTGKSLTLNKSNKWKSEFKDLDVNDTNGKKIKYEVEEVVVSGYGSTISKPKTNEFTIKNKLKVDLTVTKKWNDEDDLDELRPTDIKVSLFANGNDTGKSLILSEENSWEGKFTELYKYDDNGKLINYTVKEEPVNEYTAKYSSSEDSKGNVLLTVTNTHEPKYAGYTEIKGIVWNDVFAGKESEINGEFDKAKDKVIQGVKVVLKDAQGNPMNCTYTDEKGNFTRTDCGYTDSNGEYTIKVNYEQRNVYKLYEDAEQVAQKLKTAYVEFEYDGFTYTTVKNKDGKNTSKAIENVDSRNNFDSAHSLIKPETPRPEKWEDKMVTASTQAVITDFEAYTDKKEGKKLETLKYCNGNGTYTKTDYKQAWAEPITKERVCENCNQNGHTIRTYGINVVTIQNVNLGLFEREQPDISISIDLSSVNVNVRDQVYTYLYGVQTSVAEEKAQQEYEKVYNEKIKEGWSKQEAELYARQEKLKAEFQDKKTYEYLGPVNPADIAYMKDPDNNNDKNKDMKIEVTYKVKIGNSSTTLPVVIHNIENYYDLGYELKDDRWSKIGKDSNNKFNIAQYKIDELVNPLEEKIIELKYEVNLKENADRNVIAELLNGKAPLNTAVEIQAYSTKYGNDTLYAEQQKGGRTGNPYGGYDNDSHPGNAEIHINDKGRLDAKIMEDDTGLAPSFILHLSDDKYKTLSGNVWEDSSNQTGEGYRLGDGNKLSSEKNVANVKVELLKRDENEENKWITAYIYSIDNSGNISKEKAVTYTNKDGNYSFGGTLDGKKYGVATDEYKIRFTYGDGIEGATDPSKIDGVTVNARNYKSTIISKNNINVYNVFKGTENDEWHLNTIDGYSIAVDDIEQRVTRIPDLQYNNFNNAINMIAFSRPFKMQVEFDSNPKKQTTVDKDGNPKEQEKWPNNKWKTDLGIFDFGIVERAREDIFVETTVEHLKITLGNGQVLLEGDPRGEKLNYVKAIGLNQKINNGTSARDALEKQILMEIDTELIQGAQLEVKYGVKVTNNSEIDIDYYDENNKQYKTEFYYFGTNTENSPRISSSVNYIVDYIDGELTSSFENPNEWIQKSAEDLFNEGFISETTSNAIKQNGYIAYIRKIENLSIGAPQEYTITAKKLLANEDENVYDNHAEILQIDAKTARTHKETGITKEYKMGNYVPSLAGRSTYTDENGNIVYIPVGTERAGLHEQDDDRLKITITPPTGETQYITTYVITGLVGLIAVAIVAIFIKKKLVNK